MEAVSPFTVKKDMARTPQILVQDKKDLRGNQINTAGKSVNGFFCSLYNPEAMTSSINPEDAESEPHQEYN